MLQRCPGKRVYIINMTHVVLDDHGLQSPRGCVHCIQRQQRVVVQLHAKGLARVPEVLIVHPPGLALVKHLEQLAELEGVVVVVPSLKVRAR